MKRRGKSLIVVASLCVLLPVRRGEADSFEEIYDLDVVLPLSLEEILDDGAPVEPASPETRPPDDELHDGDPGFGFLPQVEFVPGSDNFIVVTWTEQGGWTGPSRAAVQRYNPQGEIVAGPTSVQDEGEDPMGHGFGWDVGVFADGTVVAAGPARFAVVDLELLDYPVCATRRFDADLNHSGPLESTFEPELVPGNDDRDVNDFLKPRIVVLPAVEGGGERYVVSAIMGSAELQKEVGGLTDNELDPPGIKVYFRIFEKDGTPVGPTRWAFPLEDDDFAWTATQGSHDIAVRPGGGFVMVYNDAPALENGDPVPIYFFDRDGNPDGEPFGVIDEDLIEFGVVNTGIVQVEISQADGVYALLHSLQIDGTDQVGLTLFDDTGEIVRSTINASRQRNYAPIRESEVAQDPSGNVFLSTRGQYRDPETQEVIGPDFENDMLTVWAITREGEYAVDPFVPYDEDGYPGSQRDPALAANENYFVVAYLSDAPPSTLGGLNAFRVFENPFRALAPETVLLLPGDANGDGMLDVSDPLAQLAFLFTSGAVPDCLKVPDADPVQLNEAGRAIMDFNGDGTHDLSDTIASLTFQFASGAPHALGQQCVELAAPECTACDG